MNRARILAGILLPVSLAALPARGAERPPVILLLVDTLRWDYLGSYGFPGPVSPHLDDLARESLRFRKCYAQAPWTKPSMASLFTSLYPGSHGLTNHEGRFGADSTAAARKGVLREKAVTLAEAMRDLGYDTAGFESNPWLTAEYGFDQGFEVFADDTTLLNAPASEVLARARAWLTGRGSDDPYFLYVHFMDVHGPYDAPDSCYLALRECAGVAGPHELTPLDRRNLPAYLREPAWAGGEAANRVGTWRARYAAGVRNLDAEIEPFLRFLRESGILDTAYLVVTADHGEELYDHKGWEHGRTLYEELIRVPLLVRPPGGVAGRTVGQVARLVDLYPTLVAIAGGDVHEDVVGRDLTPFFQAGAEPAPAVIYATAAHANPRLYALTVGRYKLILDRRDRESFLFDLVRDPGERRNLAARKKKLAGAMRDHLLRWVQARPERALFEPSEIEISPETRKRLEALGYLDSGKRRTTRPGP